MKKLMIAGVAGLCAAVTFALESANVVGYQIIKVPAGFTLFTPTFKGVAGELDLTTISICDENGADLPLYNEVGIQKMDASGAYLDTYGFCPDVGGWNVDFAAIEAEDVTFKVGETMCVANDSGADVYFKVSGEVDLINKNLVGQGFVLWGNSTPVEIDLTEVSVVDAEGNELPLYNEVGVQKMSADGAYLKGYGFCPDVGGWNIDFAAIEKGEFTLKPGEAVCVANDCGQDVYFKLPSPVK